MAWSGVGAGVAELRQHVTFATFFTIVSAIGGFAAKYLNDRATDRRKDRLERISLQLRNLYGPLYANERAHAIAWGVFRQKYRPGGDYFSPNRPISEEEKAAWRLWICEVFMPFRTRMETAIMENGDLLLEDSMPDCLLLLCAHVEAFRPVLKRWTQQDFGDHTSLVEFPREQLSEYARVSYLLLIQEQQHLLGKLKLGKKPQTKDTGAKS